jgi:hypothetical protein
MTSHKLVALGLKNYKVDPVHLFSIFKFKLSTKIFSLDRTTYHCVAWYNIQLPS